MLAPKVPLVTYFICHIITGKMYRDEMQHLHLKLISQDVFCEKEAIACLGQAVPDKELLSVKALLDI